jgi:putative endonuclease
MSRKKATYQKGLWGEWLAEFILRVKGYSILERRYKTKSGEIDLIARKKNRLVFIEVKTRAHLDTALSSIPPRTQQRITRAAQYYIARHPDMLNHEMRFDVIAIQSAFLWRHIYNAWMITA